MADLKTTPAKTPPREEVKPKKRRPVRRSLWMAIGLLAGFVIYAYGFQVVNVNLDTIGDPVRQGRFANIIRALGSPDLLTYETIATNVDIDFAMPCPADGFTAAASEGGAATISIDPPCADSRGIVTVSGEGFGSNEPINIFFVPPNGIELRVAQVRTNADGVFSTEAQLPNRPDEQVQTIRAKTRERVGSIFNPVYVPTGQTNSETGEEIVLRSPRWSANAEATWRGIIQTIFLALLATTVGTIIAMPLSFLAARNLMSDVRIPVLNVGLAIVALPVGAVLGYAAASGGGGIVDRLPGSALLLGAVTMVLVWLGFRALRFAVPLPDTERPRWLRVGAGLAAAAAFLLASQSAVRFMEIGGAQAASVLGPLAFLGTFVQRLGEIMALVFGVLAGLAAAVALAIFASKLAYAIAKNVGPGMNQVLSVVAVGLAGAAIAVGIGQAIAWMYQIIDTTATVVIPAAIGAVLGVGLGVWGAMRGQLGAGLGIYYIFRTFFNTLRSIEALILALVFVVWVGLGAFAGTLALALHTIAANAKLYSEQVESISSGPLEAVRATGATRLQTVIYAVVPQIVAPFIAFTMYRWDINVRMSTIIGFVGGGGIGLILQQNINQLNYRGAAAQILAIAIVVAAMDYVSSRLRERYV
ncbi:MAG TPA: ABC transporter permease subunit [Acidimicrobiia bacterium]|nr:ABC transporter permease subunit [Acidimicrobiia bacterium]